ncbi:MAG: glutamine-hydrolyzing carbamoyl-phosphate synthase small subunit [Alphaproteobacteria bacterium]|nr:glutamine-hydrolyzing carbamoyl-phosphate synthase small subunit [Alphaproteobacteria bacterium]
MSDDSNPTPASDAGESFARKATGVLVLASGEVFYGEGFGATGHRVAEVCFNTAMTGYQEILTDPSYAGQIVVFTFPHIGNVGTNLEDVETRTPAVRGLIVKARVTEPSNYRAASHLSDWLSARGIVGLAGIDTRRLARLIRENGMPNGVIAHSPDGSFDIEALKAEAREWPGLVGMDLAREVTAAQSYGWTEAPWTWANGYGRAEGAAKFKVVAIDYGIKSNILRELVGIGADVTVVPANASVEDVLRHKPDGVFLSNGPGDPAATGAYAVPVIKALIEAGKPVFGICLGHQMLALAAGAETRKMSQGHHGANHPVKDVVTGKVEITSMNHGFTVDAATLPANVQQTHVSLFDGTNAGIAWTDRPVFGVQYHPEASPGPHDSHYLFHRFAEMMGKA